MNNTYSVGQLNSYIKNMFRQDFLLNRVSVKGEISNLKDHPSGHIYFTLKDSNASISAVMFAGSRLKGLKCELRNGKSVIVTGSVDIYEAGGRYELYAREIRAEGEGELYRRFLELKQELEERGMFDPLYKKPIPKYVRTVGIVTSASGAAIHDIMQITARRNPYVQLILSPAIVQGDPAPASIVRAIERLDACRPDVMIVGRGGGSQEDLWCFNDREVAEAIFNADTPVISAVGHETDFTIADFVADLRAPTPSAAAELAVFDCFEFLRQLNEKENRITTLLRNQLDRTESRLKRDRIALKLYYPGNVLAKQQEKLENCRRILTEAMEKKNSDVMLRYRILAEKLNAVSPLKKLAGGFGYVSLNGHPLCTAEEAQLGDLLRIRLHDGEIAARTESVNNGAEYGN